MHTPNGKIIISVVIPTYNRSRLLDYSMHSLQRQGIDTSRFEVIIADDGSSDDTRDLIGKYEKVMNVKYVYQEDRGYRPASARNLGIRAAEGDICLFLDSGVLVNPDCIEQHIDFYKRMGDKAAAVGYVYGFERTKDSERQLMELVDPEDAAASILRISKNEIFSDIREEHYVRHNYKIHDLPAPWYYFWTCHVSAPRKELLAAGLFDENYDGRWGVEDNDLAMRLLLNGNRIYLLRNAEAIHYPHEKDKGERRLEGLENCRYFNEKFKTVETRIFLDTYLEVEDFVDINKISLETKLSVNA